jgi:hypothetical protein
MRKLLLASIILFSVASTYGQSIQITDMSAMAVIGGMNVNVKTISFNGAGYLSYSYVITGTTVDLSVCYYFNLLLPILTFDNDFFIPITEAGNYTVNVTVYNSSSTETCDYFSIGGSESTTVLSLPGIQAGQSQFILYPNPTTGTAEMASDVARVDALSVYDTTGKLVIQLVNNVRGIDLSNLSNGVYLVKMTVDDQSFVQQIVKK